MRFYTQQHKYYCGIDLHTQKMHVCIINENGEIKEHRNMKTDRDLFLKIIAPFREDEVIRTYDVILSQLENSIIKMANHHDPVSYALLQTIPGVGKILALVMLYEIENIRRFPSVQDFMQPVVSERAESPCLASDARPRC